LAELCKPQKPREEDALFWKFRDQIMGVAPVQDPGPGKAKTKINELNTHIDKPRKGKETQT
jgi:hypothetical protein